MLWGSDLEVALGLQAPDVPQVQFAVAPGPLCVLGEEQQLLVPGYLQPYVAGIRDQSQLELMGDQPEQPTNVPMSVLESRQSGCLDDHQSETVG